jgi:hypothetical protein
MFLRRGLISTVIILSACKPSPFTCSSELIVAPGTPSGNLSVDVVGTDGRGIPGVGIFVSPNYTTSTCPSYFRYVTDAGGHVEISSINPGNYSINLQDSQPAVYQRFDIVAGQEIEIKLIKPNN